MQSVVDIYQQKLQFTNQTNTNSLFFSNLLIQLY